MKLKAVSLELAKKLKELGFDIECSALYRPYCGEELYSSININPIEPEPIHNDWASAPTLELAKKWFSNVHEIHVVVEPCTLEYYTFKILIVDISKLRDYDTPPKIRYRKGRDIKDKDSPIRYFDTYDWALEAGLLTACNKILNK